MWCNKRWIIRGDNHLPWSTGYVPGDTVQDAASQLCCQGLAVCQHLQGLPCRTAPPSPSVPSLYPCQGLFLPGARLGSCPWWASSGSRYPIPPAFEESLTTCPSLKCITWSSPAAWCHLRTWWECTTLPPPVTDKDRSAYRSLWDSTHSMNPKPPPSDSNHAISFLFTQLSLKSRSIPTP